MWGMISDADQNKTGKGHRERGGINFKGVTRIGNQKYEGSKVVSLKVTCNKKLPCMSKETNVAGVKQRRRK